MKCLLKDVLDMCTTLDYQPLVIHFRISHVLLLVEFCGKWISGLELVEKMQH